VERTYYKGPAESRFGLRRSQSGTNALSGRTFALVDDSDWYESLDSLKSLSTRKTSGKADCGAAAQRGSRTETARKLSEQGLIAFVWSR
jgi:hypothetical protein